ncbi:MAG: hypothetical protein LIP01_15880 [Tannerellaceae bacterium]|nr:hypothetical protein [Tannerellaceae bacterium]
MQQVTPRLELDFSTLKHVTGHYFTDRNGLYYLGYQRNSLFSRKLRNAPEPGTDARVFSYYMVYGSSVYSLCDLEEIRPLHLNAEKMTEIQLERVDKTILTDGENHYIRTKSRQHVANIREEESWIEYGQVKK